MKKNYVILLTGLCINALANCAASSSQQSIPAPTIQPCANLKELALKALIAHPAQLAKDLPALHNENNPFYEQRYTLPAKSINNALLARMGFDAKQLDIKKDMLSGLVISPDSKIIATWERKSKKLKLSDLQTGNLVRTLSQNEPVHSASFSPDGAILTRAVRHNIHNERKGIVRLWNPYTGKLLRRFTPDTRGATNTVPTAFNSDGSLIALGSWNNIISLCDTATGEVIRTFELQTQILERIGAIAFSPDDTLLAAESEDGIVMLWNAFTGELISKLQGDPGFFVSLVFSSDGRKLSASSFGAIKVWDIATEALKFNLESRWKFRHAIISPDGRKVAAVQENTIRLWNIHPLQLHTISDHTGSVISLAFSPNGKILVSGSLDRTIRLWDTETGALIQILENNNFLNGKLVFSPDGTTLIAYSIDPIKGLKSYVHVWRLDYKKDLQTISDIEEQQFLLHAAQDWLTGNPYKVSKATYPIYKTIIQRFGYLHDSRLFDTSEVGMLQKLSRRF